MNLKRILTVIALLLCLVALFGCAQETTLEQLRDAYIARGAGVDGYEVTEISQGDGYSYFSVGILIHAGTGLPGDADVFTEAHLFRFDQKKDAEAARLRNAETGVGGECEQIGNFVLLWNGNDGFDEFTDLYKDVFRKTLKGD